MDFFNDGPENWFLSQNASDVGAIRAVIMEKREILKCIDRLVEKRKGIEEDLVRLSAVVAPHNHNRLPNEVLSRIFILVAQEYGPVHFPTPKSTGPPPQFAISHVCSHWRRVALHTCELWSNTYLTYPRRRNLDKAVYLRHWRRWFMRAGTLPVRLSIDFDDWLLDDDEIAGVLQTIILPFRIKRLHLPLTYRNLAELSTLPEATLSDPMDLTLDLTLHDDEQGINMNLNDPPHHLITRLRSLSIHSDDSELDVWLDKLSPALPWSQLQSLNLGDIFVTDLRPIIELLHQTPNLQALDFLIRNVNINTLPVLTMPSLRDFCLRVDLDEAAYVDDGADADAVLHCFTCPSLVRLQLYVYARWTVESFKIIKGQYNMQGLEEIKLIHFPLSVSSILQNAPMLRTLSVRRDAILDDAAIIGISTGTLGRCLTNLTLFHVDCDVNEVIDMVETRMKTVNVLIGNSRSWREDVTIIKDVSVHTKNSKDKRQEFAGVIAKLKEAGINIAIRP